MEDEPAQYPAWAAEQVHVVEPDPAWPRLAERFAQELRRLLDGWLTGEVLHVGSTAIPGLPAKPIIDLQAIADDPAAAITGEHHELVANSWFFVPRHLDQRPWRWFVVRADATRARRLAHLHLMRPGERRWNEQLTFRDRLRADPDLAAQYAALKARAAAEHPADREAYTEAKADFVHSIINLGTANVDLPQM